MTGSNYSKLTTDKEQGLLDAFCPQNMLPTFLINRVHIVVYNNDSLIFVMETQYVCLGNSEVKLMFQGLSTLKLRNAFLSLILENIY